jgi:hypothetical protein
MAAVSAKVEGTGKNKELVIRVPMQEASQSSSGKSMVVATTRGSVETEAEVDGKPVVVSVNAFYYKKR